MEREVHIDARVLVDVDSVTWLAIELVSEVSEMWWLVWVAVEGDQRFEFVQAKV